MRQTVAFFAILSFIYSKAQDLSHGLSVNDLSPKPMSTLLKPDYLQTVFDANFGTNIRRISEAEVGSGIVPMYSTIQAWNADESYLILYDLSNSTHILLDGQDYHYIRHLNDLNPDDLEGLYWHFEEPDTLFYLDAELRQFMAYSIGQEEAAVLVDFNEILPECNESLSLGSDIQMMSWDSEYFGFRCGNSHSFIDQLSTQELTEVQMEEVGYTAAMPSASGAYIFHQNRVYDSEGNLVLTLNAEALEHGCLGKLSNGHDAYFAIAFEEGPDGFCQGDVVAHDLETGNCFVITGPSLGYDYPQSGTHLSAISHKNTETGWLCASFIGYHENGQNLLDQELIIAKADPQNPIVCRIGHHRSDENEFDYWGEPHPVISPSGTRILFGSDWSGNEDGQSVDSYVLELPIHNILNGQVESTQPEVHFYPNPNYGSLHISGVQWDALESLRVINQSGQTIPVRPSSDGLDLSGFVPGLYHIFFRLNERNQTKHILYLAPED